MTNNYYSLIIDEYHVLKAITLVIDSYKVTIKMKIHSAT